MMVFFPINSLYANFSHEGSLFVICFIRREVKSTIIHYKQSSFVIFDQNLIKHLSTVFVNEVFHRILCPELGGKHLKTFSYNPGVFLTLDVINFVYGLRVPWVLTIQLYFLFLVSAEQLLYLNRDFHWILDHCKIFKLF